MKRIFELIFVFKASLHMYWIKSITYIKTSMLKAAYKQTWLVLLILTVLAVRTLRCVWFGLVLLPDEESKSRRSDAFSIRRSREASWLALEHLLTFIDFSFVLMSTEMTRHLHFKTNFQLKSFNMQWNNTLYLTIR